jgi:hypothetical protein
MGERHVTQLATELELIENSKPHPSLSRWMLISAADYLSASGGASAPVSVRRSVWRSCFRR